MEGCYLGAVIAIDPGKCAGWARFDDATKRLVACGLYQWREKDALPPRDGVTIVELPRVYPAGRQPVPPNDLITLAYRAGLLARAVAQDGCIETVYPHEWKKQVPDEILYSRILRELEESERKVIEAAGCAKSTKHNMLDAVGIGLVKVGRALPGIARIGQ